MPSNVTWVCVKCREVFKQTQVCPRCQSIMIYRWHWRAPKKNNHRAWKMIEAGEWLWDKRLLRKLEVDIWGRHPTYAKKTKAKMP